MNDFLKKSLQLLVGIDDSRPLQVTSTSKTTRQDLISKEGKIGGQLFGPIPEGCNRLFYNLDHDTWVWYEEWADDAGIPVGVTTRYEIHPNGVLKNQEGAPAYYIEGRELNSFLSATGLYYERVTREMYHRDPTTGRLLTA
ncbi:MAG: hypothetical protein JWN75_736 [Candidatus Saccharibacteria bacterium]|nr:hypothetical protein [Candidatus Saccharibacteria bacterium]